MRDLCVYLLMLLAALPLSAELKTIWSVGIYDQSSLEFTAVPRDYVSYEIGKSDWAKDWPGEQRSGSVYEIRFNLEKAPRGIFVLRISVLTYSPRIPAIQVQINGHKGLYYLHPKLSYHLGDMPMSVFDPHYSSDLLTIEIPGGYLKTGMNILSLSCVASRAPYVAQNVFTGMHYDFISLANDAGETYVGGTINAQVIPTIFYQNKGTQLAEVVEASLRFWQATQAGTASLMINGKRYTAIFPAKKDFGEERVDFEIPEWSGTLPARLTVMTAGTHAAFDLSLTAERKWTVFVVPHTHVDVGYSDYQGKVSEIQSRTLDEAASLITKYPNFRFSSDGSWNFEQFAESRSKRKQEEVLNLVRDDKIGIPAQYANLLTGYASLETLYRSLYYSKWLSRKYNLPFVYANSTDVPTYTQAYPSILANAGVRYWLAGGDNYRAPFLSHEAWNEKSPFWWAGPDGKKVLFWYSRCYEQVMFLFGLPPQQAAVYESLPIFLQAYSKPSYKLDVALIFGTQPENTDLFSETATFATKWNKQYVYPRLQYATVSDFFQYVEKHYGKDLPTYTGDMGPYWEDGVGSDAYYTALSRQSQSDALSAEVVSTVSHNVNPDVNPPKGELNDAWKNIVLYSEHTWTAGNSVTQPSSEEAVKQLAVKDNRATQAQFEIADIDNRAMSQLANEIHVAARTLVVFNTLNWKRNALIETDLGENEELIDLTTHQPVPVEAISNKQGFVRARFLASDLPAVGYKCYQIRTTEKSISAEPQIDKNPVIENQYYRIKIDAQSGAIQSIFDKQLQRELVDIGSPYKFGQYLYVTGGDGNTRLTQPFESLPPGKVTIHPSGNGEYLGTRREPWGYSIKLRSSSTNTPTIKLEVLLYNTEKKIEFRYCLDKTYTTTKEAVYFAFPVAAFPPKFLYATQQGWVDPSRDMFRGANLEWFSIQKWMAVEDAHLAIGIVPIDAPLATFGDINRGKWPGEFHPGSSTLFSYVMNNYWDTNYRAGQGGSFEFRYVVTSAEHLNTVALTRLGWESMEQPVVDHILDQDKADAPGGALPSEGAGFLTVDAPNIVLDTWKLAEDGRGTILRLEETAGHSTEAIMRFQHFIVGSASLCNAMEDNLQKLDVDKDQITVKFRPHEVLTVRIEP